MQATTGLIVAVVFIAFLLGCNGRTVLTVAHNTTTNLVCTDGSRFPTWFVNGITVGTVGQCNRSSYSINGGMVSATLTIDGNCICGTLNIHCEAYIAEERQLAFLHNTTLTIQGRLPSPENVHINETNNIEWKPPYSAMNNDTVHVDAQITQYTVYITDIYTGNTIKENVTETRFTFNTQEDDSCPMYQLSAWNTGGEGDLSEPMLESTSRVPHSITAEKISVAVTEESNALLNIHIDVDMLCPIRIPEFFLITLMTPDGSVLKESNMTHEPGQAVADFTISLPQTVDVCTLHVRISAGNSAGMSVPSEAVEIVCSGGNTESTIATTTDSTTVTVSPTTASTGERQQDNTILIVIIIGVIAAVGIMLIMAVVIRCCLKHKSKNSKVDPPDQPDNYYSESPGPVLYKPQVASHPESTSITDSEGSNDHLLQSNPPAPVGSPHLVYAQLEAVEQTQVLPPANDDPVQYAQIKQQDKL